MSDPIPAEAVQPEAAPPDCNGEPHVYAYEHGAHSPVSVGRCMVCGAIDWADLVENVGRIREQARTEGRAEERARIVGEFRALSDYLWALPDAGLNVGQRFDRDQQAWFWRDLADKIERGDGDG